MVSRWIRSGPQGRNWFDRSSRGKWEIWGDHRGVRHHCDHLRGPCRCGSGYHRCCGGQYFQAECGDKTEEAKISNKFHLTQVWTTLCCCCTINVYAFIVQHLCILLWTHTVHLGGSLTSAKTFALLRRRHTLVVQIWDLASLHYHVLPARHLFRLAPSSSCNWLYNASLFANPCYFSQSTSCLLVKSV